MFRSSWIYWEGFRAKCARHLRSTSASVLWSYRTSFTDYHVEKKRRRHWNTRNVIEVGRLPLNLFNSFLHLSSWSASVILKRYFTCPLFSSDSHQRLSVGQTNIHEPGKQHSRDTCLVSNAAGSITRDFFIEVRSSDFKMFCPYQVITRRDNVLLNRAQVYLVEFLTLRS